MDRDRGPEEKRKASDSPLAKRSTPTGAEFAGLGLQFAMTIAVFVFAGLWLDGRFHTSPWLTIVFTFVGAGGGFYSMYRRATAALRERGQDGR